MQERFRNGFWFSSRSSRTISPGGKSWKPGKRGDTSMQDKFPRKQLFYSLTQIDTSFRVAFFEKKRALNNETTSDSECSCVGSAPGIIGDGSGSGRSSSGKAEKRHVHWLSWN